MRKTPLLPFFAVVLILSSCIQKTEVPAPSAPATEDSVSGWTAPERKERPHFKSIGEATRSDTLFYWIDEANYYPALHFETDTTLFLLFDRQCLYHFPYRMRDGMIAVYWEPRSDCAHDIGIDAAPQGVPPPATGSVFMTLGLGSDTTLDASYRYPDWVALLNKRNTPTGNCRADSFRQATSPTLLGSRSFRQHFSPIVVLHFLPGHSLAHG